MYYIRNKNRASNFAQSKLDSEKYNEAVRRAMLDYGYDSAMNTMRKLDPVLSLPTQLAVATHDIGRYSLLKKLAATPLTLPVDLLTAPVNIPYGLYRMSDFKDPKNGAEEEASKLVNKEIKKIFTSQAKSNSLLPEGSKLTK